MYMKTGTEIGLTIDPSLYMVRPWTHIGIELALKSREEGNSQESIQSSTSPDPEHHMGK